MKSRLASKLAAVFAAVLLFGVLVCFNACAMSLSSGIGWVRKNYGASVAECFWMDGEDLCGDSNPDDIPGYDVPGVLDAIKELNLKLGFSDYVWGQMQKSIEDEFVGSMQLAYYGTPYAVFYTCYPGKGLEVRYTKNR